jgi:Serine protease inhibitor
MKTNYFLILFIAPCILLASCKKTNTSQDKPVQFTKSQVAVLNSSNQFGFNLFKDMASASADNDNLFISPLSISFALTMTYNGAANQTSTDMQTALCYGDLSKETINESCKELMQILLNLDPKVAMEIANSIWYRNTFPVRTDFLNLNKTYFDAEVEPADFNDPHTVDLINGWVNTKTHEKIPNVITEIPSDMVMYLINAIYFKGAWTYRFETKNTEKATFYLTDGTPYQTDFMNMKEKFRYMKNDLLSAVEMPYGKGDFSMMVLLPNEGKTYNDVISNLSSENWTSWTSKLDSTNVFVNLPKFKFSYKKTLNQDLVNLGMGIAFDPSNADFTGINEAGQLYISFVLHKSFVEVNEEGTEAAAVTVVGVSLTSVGPAEPVYVNFNVNKPFIFAIKENSTNSILFMGLVKKPVIE